MYGMIFFVENYDKTDNLSFLVFNTMYSVHVDGFAVHVIIFRIQSQNTNKLYRQIVYEHRSSVLV